MDGLLFFILMAVLGVITAYSYCYGISPTPTSPKVQRELLLLLPELKNQEIAELGSGWGTLAFALARHFPTCHVHAYEVSPFPYLVSTIFSKCFLLRNVSIKRHDFFQVSLKNISLVVCYLYPEAMQQLKIKLEKELSPEAYILSHTFAIPGWIPVDFARASDLYKTPIYLYTHPSARMGEVLDKHKFNA